MTHKPKKTRTVKEKKDKSFIGWTHKDNFLKSDRLIYGQAVIFDKVRGDTQKVYVKVKVMKL